MCRLQGKRSGASDGGSAASGVGFDLEGLKKKLGKGPKPSGSQTSASLSDFVLGGKRGEKRKPSSGSSEKSGKPKKAQKMQLL